MSIEALNWARKTYVGDSLAKSLLRGIADYADENGKAWPSHARLAADCEMSESTVKRRIAQLEELGLLVTFRCWIDDHGRRNHERTGRETSRDIVLSLKVTREHPTDYDAGDDDAGSADSTPSTDNEGVLSAPHGVPGEHPGGSHVNTPNEPSLNRKNSPQAPQAGGGVILEGEAKRRFDWFFTNCIGYRTQQATQQRAMDLFAALDDAEQIACAAASPAHAAELTKLKKKSLDAWKLIRDRYWVGYPEARMPEPKPEPIWISDATDLDALRKLALITGGTPPKLGTHPDHAGIGVMRLAPITDDLRSLAAVTTEDLCDWEVVEPDTREFKAWRQRIHDWTGLWLEARLVMRHGTHMLTMLPGQAPREVKNRANGIPVPWRWPPKKDGQVYDGTNGDNHQ